MDDGRAQWSTSIVLSDGDTAFVRGITVADAPRLLAFHERQPRDNLYRRFLSPKPTLNERELDHFTNIDFHDRVALVVEDRGEFIAWASYERWKARDDAEVAFMVDADHQGRGIATLLLEHLAAIARTNGIHRFTAEALSDNRAMLRVFSRAGWPVERHYESGLTEIEFSLDETERFVDSVEGREHRADSRAVARLLLPRSIAIIGASDQPGSVGHELWHNTTAVFDGPVYPVNARHDAIGGHPAFASVLDIDDDVWLAVIAVPGAALAATVDQCIAKKVRGALVITATDGLDIDIAALVAHARRNGMRLIGPASMGIAAPRPTGGMNAALVPGRLPYGSVAISMQSGSLGAALLQLAAELHLGVSWFISLGDKSDISGNDLLQFWEDDESTSVIAMYTESFGNPRKFARLARRVGRTRPIVAVRTGTAAIGDAANALYQQAGLIEVPTVRAMLDAARVFATQPVPRGPNVAVLSNSRSPGVLAAAALATAGLTPVDPPVHLDWRSTADDFAAAITAAVQSDAVDALLVIHAPPLPSAHGPSHEIDTASLRADKPVLAVMLGGSDGPLLPGSAVPAFSFPEPAAAVLGRMYAYSRWRATEADAAIDVSVGVDPVAASEVIRRAILAEADGEGDADRRTGRLSLADAGELLRTYGIATPPAVAVHTADSAAVVAAADEVGYPVVVKADRRRVGRSARAGIALDLGDAHAVTEAVAIIRGALGDDADALVVQAMAAPGVDVHIRCATDDLLGAVVTLDLGSLQTAGTGDSASRLVPLSRVAADALIETSRVGGALAAAHLDPAPLVDTILRLAQLMDDHPELAEIDIDPAIVSNEGCVPTDARIRVQAIARSAFPIRRLG
ncbi:MAG: putative acetyltransferase [Ilumatobacteraceae bacterium]|nr:putative acetyltransferase [Ilumatobacteraceae bacterium]